MSEADENRTANTIQEAIVPHVVRLEQRHVCSGEDKPRITFVENKWKLLPVHSENVFGTVIRAACIQSVQITAEHS
jgi:hypothetical protein